MGRNDQRKNPLAAFAKDCLKALAIFLVVAAVVAAADRALVSFEAASGQPVPASLSGAAAPPEG
jgi:hypothetical protein